MRSSAGPAPTTDIEKVRSRSVSPATSGIPIVEYNWYALACDGGLLRGGRTRRSPARGARLRPQPRSAGPGRRGPAQRVGLWTRYERFLKAVVPVAERAGVRLAVHPNDPPPPRYRGTNRFSGRWTACARVRDREEPGQRHHLRHRCHARDGSNVIENIRWFGAPGPDQSRALPQRPDESAAREIHRTFIDAGDNDMMACLRALHQTGYPRLLHPDHVPTLPGDLGGQRGGWGYAVGQIKAMLRQL